MEWVSELVASGEITSLIISAVLLFMTGGGIVAIINGIVASKRGIKGDALVKEQNGISGLGKLAEGQDAFITQLREELKLYKQETDGRIDKLEKALADEIEHSSNLTQQLIENNIVPVHRHKH